MPAHSTVLREELRIELNRLVVRRTRVALLIGLTTVVAFAAGNHLWWSPDLLRSDMINGVTALLIGIAFAVLAVPAVRRRPVPFALVIFAFGCVIRAGAGVDHGDVAPTAITLVGLALVGAATMPWGVLPQIVTATVAGSAIAMNSYLVTGDLGPPSGQAATAGLPAVGDPATASGREPAGAAQRRARAARAPADRGARRYDAPARARGSGAPAG